MTKTQKRAAEIGVFALILLIGFTAGVKPSLIPFVGKHFESKPRYVVSAKKSDRSSRSSPTRSGKKQILFEGVSGRKKSVPAGSSPNWSKQSLNSEFSDGNNAAQGTAFSEEGAAGEFESGSESPSLESLRAGESWSGGSGGQSGSSFRGGNRNPARRRIGSELGERGSASSALTSIAKQAGSTSGFEHGSRNGPSGGGSNLLGRSTGAPGTGTGKSSSQTLFISAKKVDLFVDPSTMESMPAGFSKRDLQSVDISYKMDGGENTITLAKGSDMMAGEQVSWSGTESSDGKWLQVSVGGVDAWVEKEKLSRPGWSNWKPGLEKTFELGVLEKGAGLTQVVQEAQKHVGDAYVWGGSSPGGFDCSGLVQYSYRKFGMKVPRVSRDQKAAATMITPEQLEPGDLIFTGNPVKHVMIYKGESDLVEAMGRKWGVVNSGLGRRTRGGKAVYYGTFRHLNKN